MNAIALKAEKRLRIPFWGLAGAVAAFMIFLWPLLYLFREAFLNPDLPWQILPRSSQIRASGR